MKPTFRLPRPARLLASLLISGGLMMGAAHAQQPPPVEEAEADTTVFPAQELTPQILYQLLLAEVAGARGQVAMAAQSYMDLAKRTRDPRIARRAAEIAVVTRQADLASEAARLWMELDPGSMQARQLSDLYFSGSISAKVSKIRINKYRLILLLFESSKTFSKTFLA